MSFLIRLCSPTEWIKGHASFISFMCSGDDPFSCLKKVNVFNNILAIWAVGRGGWDGGCLKKVNVFNSMVAVWAVVSREEKPTMSWTQHMKNKAHPCPCAAMSFCGYFQIIENCFQLEGLNYF